MRLMRRCVVCALGQCPGWCPECPCHQGWLWRWLPALVGLLIVLGLLWQPFWAWQTPPQRWMAEDRG